MQVVKKSIENNNFYLCTYTDLLQSCQPDVPEQIPKKIDIVLLNDIVVTNRKDQKNHIKSYKITVLINQNKLEG